MSLTSSPSRGRLSAASSTQRTHTQIPTVPGPRTEASERRQMYPVRIADTVNRRDKPSAYAAAVIVHNVLCRGTCTYISHSHTGEALRLNLNILGHNSIMVSLRPRQSCITDPVAHSLEGVTISTASSAEIIYAVWMDLFLWYNLAHSRCLC